MLTGSMDIRDFHTLMREMPALSSLDLSGVQITAYRYLKPVTSGPSSSAADELPAAALLGMHLSELTLPTSLTVIGEGALAGNDFTTLTLPATLTTIADNALYGCTALQSVTLPASVTSVGSYAFAGCTALKSADLSATSLTSLPDRTFNADTALEQIKLPSSLQEIGQGCFSGTSALRDVHLPSSLRSIGAHAFSGSGLEQVSVPAGVTAIGDFAFSNCHNLREATIDKANISLGRALFFSDPALVSFQGKRLNTLPDYMFAGNPDTDLTEQLKDVTTIGAYALKDNQADSLSLNYTLTYIGDGAMENMTALRKLDVTALDGRVPELGNDVFAGIDQPAVELQVAKNLKGPWEDADQWKEFDIVEYNVTDVDEVYAENTVECRFAGTLLQLRSTEPMKRVEVYDPAGARVADIAPRASEASIQTDHLSARVYIVKVSLSDNRVSTFKLMR